ncbi:hypothetical protein C0995_013426 [Termitomyces sp. Mi166|nr:hypothetical protein C0995_013426 [Termitomyces sp. Mi166\
MYNQAPHQPTYPNYALYNIPYDIHIPSYHTGPHGYPVTGSHPPPFPPGSHPAFVMHPYHKPQYNIYGPLHHAQPGTMHPPHHLQYGHPHPGGPHNGPNIANSPNITDPSQLGSHPAEPPSPQPLIGQQEQLPSGPVAVEQSDRPDANMEG